MWSNFGPYFSADENAMTTDEDDHQTLFWGVK
jgi:hypothetical protein